MRMSLLISLLLLVVPQAWAGEARSYGTPMPEGEAHSIAAIMNSEAPLSAAPQKITGRITEVCQAKGCWVMLEDSGHAARVMMHEHAFSVPKDSAGATATVYGTVSVKQLDEKAAKHLAEDAGKDAPVALREFRVDATSIVLTDA